jgi:hypothetical protein
MFSVTDTGAVDGPVPVFRMSTTYPAGSPMWNPVLVTLTFDCSAGTFDATAGTVSDVVVDEFGPTTVTVLTRGPVAVGNTVTGMVIAGYPAPDGSASARVHVTTWPAMEQTHPEPLALRGVIPAAIVCVIVTVPVWGAAPTLLTVIV